MELPQGQQIHVRQPHIIFTISDPELCLRYCFMLYSILIDVIPYISGILAVFVKVRRWSASLHSIREVEWHPSSHPGEVFVPTRAVDSMDPRLEETLTLSPFLIPSLSASTMFISINDLPSISISSGVFPVMALVV